MTNDMTKAQHSKRRGKSAPKPPSPPQAKKTAGLDRSPAASAERKKLFIAEYLKDLNATQAAIRVGFSEKTARSQGQRLLTNVDVRAAIDRAIAERAERTRTDADMVTAHLREIVDADPNEICQHRRVCCRHCWAPNFAYQRTQAELDDDRRDHAAEDAKAEASGYRLPEFDEKGGVGYVGTRPANPACPECWGEGVGRIFLQDTRKLGSAALKLYGGVKQTKDGIEIKLHSKEWALGEIARHNGMSRERVTVDANVTLASSEEMDAFFAEAVEKALFDKAAQLERAQTIAKTAAEEALRS